MNKLKENYYKVENWLKDKDLSKVKFLQGQSNRHNKLGDVIYWYDAIKDSKCQDLIFGDKLITLEDIGKHMLQHLATKDDRVGSYDEDDEEEYGGNGLYDSAGYATSNLYNEVVNFFQNLDKSALRSIAFGSTRDDYEIDIDGGRSYLMRGSNIDEYIFNYMYYTLLIGKEGLEAGVHNNDETTELLGEYSKFCDCDVSLPTQIEFDDMYYTLSNKKVTDTVYNYNRDLEQLIKSYNQCSILSENLNILKGLKVSNEEVMRRLRDEQIDKVK